MRYAGIDIGGTKIEARIFDAALKPLQVRRTDTPTTSYDAFVAAIVQQIEWIRGIDGTAPLGLSIAGAFDPETGLAQASNLPTSGRPLVADLEQRIGAPFAALNDCAAFALSEANGGAADGAPSMVGLIMGTGIGAGHCVSGAPCHREKGVAVEVGHLGIPRAVIDRLDLPDVRCGCGRVGCFETYVSGRGITRIAKIRTGQAFDGRGLAAALARGDPDGERVYETWLVLARELMSSIQIMLAPRLIVLGGGLSHLPDVTSRIMAVPAVDILNDFAPPTLALAIHGDTSGARGAALLAKNVQESE